MKDSKNTMIIQFEAAGAPCHAAILIGSKKGKPTIAKIKFAQGLSEMTGLEFIKLQQAVSSAVLNGKPEVSQEVETKQQEAPAENLPVKKDPNGLVGALNALGNFFKNPKEFIENLEKEAKADEANMTEKEKNSVKGAFEFVKENLGIKKLDEPGA